MRPWIERSAGVLLHVTSLPDGRVGGDARRFADFARDAGFTVWQILPVGPIDAQGSPYQPSSAMAGRVELFAGGADPAPAEIAQFREANADWLDDDTLVVSPAE